MSLFAGQAWFSPRVPTAVRNAWTAHGGIVADSHGDHMQATYLFCDGNEDPWFLKLYQRSMAVFHWLWVTAVVNARFRMSISAYAIDEHTALDVSECPAPAYSHGTARRVDGVRVQQVVEDCGSQSDDASASRARIFRKSVRILETSATPQADAQAAPSHHKRKSVPFVDLRSVKEKRVKEKRKASTSKRSRSSRVALCASGKPSSQVLLPREHEDPQKMIDILVSAPVPGPSSQAISVSAALESLGYVSTQRTTQFIPGALYQGKEFRCFYMR